MVFSDDGCQEGGGGGQGVHPMYHHRIWYFSMMGVKRRVGGAYGKRKVG